MNFLSWPIERHQLSKRSQRRRKAAALRLIDLFAIEFRTVEYDLYWDTPIINAQAWRLGSIRRVTISGGLVRHPAITTCGLSLVLAHETGHHLGGFPLDPDLRWPTWQGQADYWAATHGMPKVFGKAAGPLTLAGAKQIAVLHSEFSTEDDEPDISLAERLEIFRAGALGTGVPACLPAAFGRLKGG